MAVCIVRLLNFGIALCIFGFSITNALAGEFNYNRDDPWGIAIGYRIAKIPYATDEDQVSDVLPLLFYEDDHLFLRGTTGGIKLYSENHRQLNLIGRHRFFDIPEGYQNEFREDGLDIGLQARFKPLEQIESRIELMADDEGRFYSNFGVRYFWESGRWEANPYATLRYKGEKFNSRYFGLDGFENPSAPGTEFSNPIGDGWDMTLGIEARYHVFSNLYVIGRAQVTSLLDSSTRNSAPIDNDTLGEVFLGVGFFGDKTKPVESELDSLPYWRFAYGWGTPSNMSAILFSWDVEDDPQNNQMTSVFYGHPVADSLFGIEALDIYITPGIVYHREADPYTDPESGITYDSQPTTEYVLAMKLYWNIYWPVHWRLGGAEGISYVSDITNLEQRNMDEKGYRGSKLMNYLDISADVNLGDLFKRASWQNAWLGYSLHHRSSIFEQSSSFGRIKGGSNYNTLYFQFHY